MRIFRHIRVFRPLRAVFGRLDMQQVIDRARGMRLVRRRIPRGGDQTQAMVIIVDRQGAGIGLGLHHFFAWQIGPAVHALIGPALGQGGNYFATGSVIGVFLKDAVAVFALGHQIRIDAAAKGGFFG